MAIIPRWEWRTFGGDLGAAEANIAEYGEQGRKESEEKYILSRNSHENVKIRYDLVDVKTLKEINADKLEQWYPAAKHGFPISAEALEEMFRVYFKAQPPFFKRDEYTYEQFLDEVVAACDALCVVDVIKTRRAFNIDGTTAEIAETSFNGVPMRTICVEHTDPALVIATVRKLGADGFENINYIKAMKKAVGLPL